MMTVIRKGLLGSWVAVCVLFIAWFAVMGSDAWLIRHLVDYPDLAIDKMTGKYVEGRLGSAIIQNNVFWDTSWTEAEYDEHIKADHVKSGKLAGARTLVAETYEAFWLYQLGLAKTGRHIVILRWLMQSYLCIAIDIVAFLLWLSEVRKAEKKVRFNVPAVVVIVEIVYGLAAVAMLVWRQFGAGFLVVAGGIFFVISLLVVTIFAREDEINVEGGSRRTRKERRQKRKARRAAERSRVEALPRTSLEMFFERRGMLGSWRRLKRRVTFGHCK